MSARFRVFLDTCVIFPQTLRDVLLTAAEHDLYFPLWSADVLDEMERNLVENRALTQQQTAHLREEMISAFPDSTVSGYQPLIASMTNHEGDRHVLAAAVRGNAEVIVTENLRHFPTAACEPYEIRPCSVDDFLSDLLSVDHERVCDVLRSIERDRRNLPLADLVRVIGIVAPQFQRGVSFHLGI
ncbi:MAG TPA: PIN domain-containing protein [Candidatus Baltobacteraceae bacterium]|nr:PIN domain-containing protein [Candidatus Baltobacteraceae bacterium]